MKKEYKVGYTQGTYDLFHIGHLNLLEKAKEKCEYLIVGVNSDELVQMYKNKKTIIKQEDRARIVEALKVVDKVEVMNSLDKKNAHNKFKFDAIFIGDDWKGTSRWNKTEKELSEIGVKVEYLPYTKRISSSKIRNTMKKEENLNNEE